MNLATVQLNSSVHKRMLKSSVEKVIKSLNDFKKEIDRLTYIDIEGENNGPLAMDPAVGRLKSNFKKLTMNCFIRLWR